jgi:hypothetical protein
MADFQIAFAQTPALSADQRAREYERLLKDLRQNATPALSSPGATDLHKTSRFLSLESLLRTCAVRHGARYVPVTQTKTFPTVP